MATRILAPNPGPFTLDGTNTWVTGSGPSVVIDPGPALGGHLDEVWRAARPIRAILLTHHHPDHAPGSEALATMSGARVLGFRPGPGEDRLRDGEIVEGGGVALKVVHTPGHTPDHVAFHDAATGALFTGDAVLGRGTSVVDPPEGDMAAYMRSLAVMRQMKPGVIYPGHGPAIWAAVAKLDEYLAHRAERERQVLQALEGGDHRTSEELVPDIYTEYPEELRAGAARSVLAHLIKLEREGRVARVGAGMPPRFRLSEVVACTTCGRPAAPRSTLCVRCGMDLLQEKPGSGR